MFLIGYFPIYQNIKQLNPEVTKEGETSYYVTFMCIVNIGWAAVQIGHMSLVPSLTYSIKRRVSLGLVRIVSIIYEIPLLFSPI